MSSVVEPVPEVYRHIEGNYYADSSGQLFKRVPRPNRIRISTEPLSDYIYKPIPDEEVGEHLSELIKSGTGAGLQGRSPKGAHQSGLFYNPKPKQDRES